MNEAPGNPDDQPGIMILDLPEVTRHFAGLHHAGIGKDGQILFPNPKS